MNDLQDLLHVGSGSRLSPEQEPLSGAELVHVYARPGATCTVADDRGVCIELHVKVASGDAFVASAIHDRLRRGARVSGRVHDGEVVQTLVFAVEDIEPTGGGRADGLLRLIEIGRARRRAPRLAPRLRRRGPPDGRPRRSPRPSDPRVAHGAHRRRLPLRRGVRVRPALLAPGENLDLHFEDEAGATIRCRIQVLRAERAVYGRTRYAGAHHGDRRDRPAAARPPLQPLPASRGGRRRRRQPRSYRSGSCSPRAVGRAASAASSAAPRRLLGLDPLAVVPPRPLAVDRPGRHAGQRRARSRVQQRQVQVAADQERDRERGQVVHVDAAGEPVGRCRARPATAACRRRRAPPAAPA